MRSLLPPRVRAQPARSATTRVVGVRCQIGAIPQWPPSSTRPHRDPDRDAQCSAATPGRPELRRRRRQQSSQSRPTCDPRPVLRVRWPMRRHVLPVAAMVASPSFQVKCEHGCSAVKKLPVPTEYRECHSYVEMGWVIAATRIRELLVWHRLDVLGWLSPSRHAIVGWDICDGQPSAGSVDDLLHGVERRVDIFACLNPRHRALRDVRPLSKLPLTQIRRAAKRAEHRTKISPGHRSIVNRCDSGGKARPQSCG
jgi:hypothetical protein